MRTVFFAFALFFAGISPALGSPLDLSYTHNTALTVPELSQPGSSFQLARTWFLPDWQAGMGSRTDTAPSGSGDATATACENTYNLNSSCTAPQTVKKTHNFGKFICYECECPNSYQYDKSNCKGEKKPGPEVCNGKSNSCVARPCSDGGYFDTGNQTGKICTPVTYGGRSCYSCKDDPCYNLTDHSNDDNCKNHGCQSKYSACSSKCQVCYSDNCHIRTGVEAGKYGCEKYFDDCSSKCEKAYADNCRNRVSKSCDYGCKSYYSDCSSACQECKACSNTCDSSNGYSLQECIGDKPITEATSTNQCGNVCRKCRARTCAEENALCPAGKLNLDYYYSNGALRCLMK